VSDLWERILTAWDNLSFRERILVGAAGGITVFGILLAGVINPLISMTDGVSARADSAEQQLEAMIRLRRDYDVVHANLSTVETRISANKEKRNLLTLLESLASQSSVTINSMEERKAQDDEKFKETRVEVRLKRVTLEDTVSYLHAIEASDRLLTVKSLRIKNRTDKSNLLDVTFNVSTFDPL
jgi:Tfp pilus assembly protein PilO